MTVNARKRSLRVGRPAKISLTEADLRDWEEGKTRLAEFATRAGVSVAAVSKAMKKLRALACPTAPASTVTPALVPSTPAQTVAAGDRMLVQPIWQQGPEGFQDNDVMTLAKSAAYGALLHAHRVLASQTDVGPTQLKTCAGVVQWSIEQLETLGVISLAKAEQEQLPKLTVRVMTAEEEAALRRGDHLRETEEDAAADAIAAAIVAGSPQM